MPIAHNSAISVGLLYIPVGLYKTTKSTSISFNRKRLRYILLKELRISEQNIL